MAKLRRRKRHLLVTMFKVFNNNCPTYLRERFHRTSEIHDYNLRGSNYDLQLPLTKTNFLKRSFSYRGAMAWNQLSNKTREMGDLTSFNFSLCVILFLEYSFLAVILYFNLLLFFLPLLVLITI